MKNKQKAWRLGSLLIRSMGNGAGRSKKLFGTLAGAAWRRSPKRPLPTKPCQNIPQGYSAPGPRSGMTRSEWLRADEAIDNFLRGQQRLSGDGFTLVGDPYPA